MQNPSPPCVTMTLDERIAQLCQPVQLRNPLVPWFLLLILERAVNDCMRSFGVCLLELLAQYRQGAFTPAPAASTAVRPSRYQRKFFTATDICATAGAATVKDGVLPAEVALSAPVQADLMAGLRPVLPRRAVARVSLWARGGMWRRGRYDVSKFSGGGEALRENCA